MYTLYSQQPSQALRWLADTATEERARALARLQSKYLPQPVVIVRRFEDNAPGVIDNATGVIANASGVIATFRNGEAQPLLPESTETSEASEAS